MNNFLRRFNLRRNQKSTRESLSKALRTRLTILSVVIFTGITIRIGLDIFLTLNTVQNNLNDLSVTATNAFNVFFLNINSDLKVTTASLSNLEDSQKVQETIRNLQVRNRYFLDILLVDFDGNVQFQRSQINREKIKKIEEQPWLNDSNNINDIYIGKVNFYQGLPYVDMAITITNEIEIPSATLLVRVDLTELWIKTLNLRIGKKGYVYLAEESGQIIIHKMPKFQQLGININQLINHSPEEISKSKSNIYQGLTGRTVFASAKKLDTMPWYLIVEQPIHSALTPVYISGVMWLIVPLIVGLIFYDMNNFSRKRIISRLNYIHRVLSNMTDKQLDVRLAVDYRDELGEIATSFNNMTIRLQESFATLEDKVTERTAELEIAKEKAEVANKAKSGFIANMSHELRTPLNAILGFSQIMMRSSNLPEDDRENMRIISTSGDYLLTLINNVLDLSKIESGKMSLNPTNFDLYSLLQEVQDLLTLKAEDKKLQLLFDYPEDLPKYVYTDETKLRQVLINLINNALKFTTEGGINVEIQNKEINPSQLPTKNHSLLFSVTDTGFGIGEDEIDQLFEAFTQTEVGKQSQEGTGLGLPISQKFVQLMGGDITVESKLGVGTTFHFEIKVDIVDGVDLEKKKDHQNVIGLKPGQPRYRILIVDDRPMNRLLLIKLLQPLGFELKEASNGQEALEIWDQWEPHLIWMDMRMPVMDGYEATQHIRGTTKGNATAIIAITASVLEEDKSIVLSSGCDDFIRKPFKESIIFEAMKKHLGIEYIYDEETPVLDDKLPSLSADDLKVMPTEWLEKVYYATKILDDDLIFDLLNEIPENHSLLTEQLTQLANNFELETIKNLIESIL